MGDANQELMSSSAKESAARRGKEPSTMTIPAEIEALNTALEEVEKTFKAMEDELKDWQAMGYKVKS